jgi:hypothetical protein
MGDAGFEAILYPSQQGGKTWFGGFSRELSCERFAD